MKKSAIIAIAFFALLGIVIITQDMMGDQSIWETSDRKVPTKYYHPEDTRSDLLTALEDVGNHTLVYLPNYRSGLLLVVDLDSGLLLGSIKLGKFLEGPYDILFTPDKTQFLCVFPRLKVVRFYDSLTFEKIGSIDLDGSYRVIGYGDYAFTFASSSKVSVIDLDEMKVIKTIILEKGAIDGVVSSDGFIYFSGDHGITKLDPRDLTTDSVVSFESEVSSIAVSNDGSKIFLAFCKSYESNWNVHIYDTGSWEKIHEISDITERPAPDGMVEDMVVTQDGNLVYSDSYGGLLNVINATSFDLMRTVPAEIPGFYRGPKGIFITSNGEYICTLSSGGVAIEGGSVDTPSGLLVMDREFNWVHEIRLGDYAFLDLLAFKEP